MVPTICSSSCSSSSTQRLQALRHRAKTRFVRSRPAPGPTAFPRLETTTGFPAPSTGRASSGATLAVTAAASPDRRITARINIKQRWRIFVWYLRRSLRHRADNSAHPWRWLPTYVRTTIRIQQIISHHGVEIGPRHVQVLTMERQEERFEILHDLPAYSRRADSRSSGLRPASSFALHERRTSIEPT
jgi:hypothetical protein